MSLPTLAQVSDVQARMPRPMTTAEQTRAGVLLMDASSLIRGKIRQDFTQAQSTMDIAPVDDQIILPQRPVVSVDALGRMSPDGKTVTPFSLWIFDGIATITLAPPSTVINAPEFWITNDWLWKNVVYQVTFTHGYATVPDDVTGVCASMVMRVLLAPGSPGVVGETIGGYQYRIADGFPSAIVAMTADEEKTLLKKYGARRNRTIEFR